MLCFRKNNEMIGLLMFKRIWFSYSYLKLAVRNRKIRVKSFLHLKSSKTRSSILFFGRNYLVIQYVHKNFRLTLFFSFILQRETSMLRIGIIGAGQYGRQHVEQFGGANGYGWEMMAYLINEHIYSHKHRGKHCYTT